MTNGKKDYRWFCAERTKNGKVCDQKTKELIGRLGYRQATTSTEYRQIIAEWLDANEMLMSQVESWL